MTARSVGWLSATYLFLNSGRITSWDCSPIPGRNKGIRRALRAVKRREAEERNARTPGWRRKAARRAQ